MVNLKSHSVALGLARKRPGFLVYLSEPVAQISDEPILRLSNPISKLGSSRDTQLELHGAWRSATGW